MFDRSKRSVAQFIDNVNEMIEEGEEVADAFAANFSKVFGDQKVSYAKFIEFFHEVYSDIEGLAGESVRIAQKLDEERSQVYLANEEFEDPHDLLSLMSDLFYNSNGMTLLQTLEPEDKESFIDRMIETAFDEFGDDEDLILQSLVTNQIGNVISAFKVKKPWDDEGEDSFEDYFYRNIKFTPASGLDREIANAYIESLYSQIADREDADPYLINGLSDQIASIISR
jgi:phosphoribosyl-ATP pyrophosphohydrolase